MAYRRLLLPLTGTAAGESALGTALIAARIACMCGWMRAMLRPWPGKGFPAP